MSAGLILLVAGIYLISVIGLLLAGKYSLSLILIGYIIANIGLYIEAIK